MAYYTSNTTGSGCVTKSKKEVLCPDCGALECLCRPRFFAGQLLTEQDLNRLDQYLKKKSRLQNRNLHGWGVVNGLVALCDPCGQIKVTKGYALDPCGNDIVVCQDTAVDICALIRKCKEQERGDWQCRPFQRPPDKDCQDLEEDWVLTVRYCEQPTRGITALRNVGCTCGRPPAACTCSGGGAPCGCGGSDCGKSRQSLKPRGASEQCEPTVICEGFAFDVFRKPEAEPEDPQGGEDDDDQDGILGNFKFEGPLYDRFICCYNALAAAIPTPPSALTQAAVTANAATMAAWQQWCCRLRENLINFFQSHPTLNCRFLEILACVTCPNPGTMSPETFYTRLQEAVATMGLIIIEAIYDCLCLALLPPAPEATDDPRVPLAVVRVRARDCKILHICNWTIHRELLTTWPAMCYWWSLFPIGKWLHAALENICCREWAQSICPESRVDPPGTTGTVAQPDPGTFSSTVGNTASVRLNPSFSHADEMGAFMHMASLSAARGSQPQDPWAFLNSVTRFNIPSKAEGLAAVERRNLPQFLLMNAVARPMGMASIQPQVLANFMKPLGLDGLVRQMAGAEAGEKTDLADRIAALEKKIKAQDKALKDLKAKTK